MPTVNQLTFSRKFSHTRRPGEKMISHATKIHFFVVFTYKVLSKICYVNKKVRENSPFNKNISRQSDF